jgi:hypothetical protein
LRPRTVTARQRSKRDLGRAIRIDVTVVVDFLGNAVAFCARDGGVALRGVEVLFMGTNAHGGWVLIA